MIGARPLVDNPRSRKNTRIAEEELIQGRLEYELPESSDGTEDRDGKRRK
jgi:DNA-directed RNA polymerase subunit K/omega